MQTPNISGYTVFDLITAPALMTAPSDFIVTYYCPLDDLFPDFLLYFHLLFQPWRSFGTSGREQIYLSAPGAYTVEYGKSNFISVDLIRVQYLPCLSEHGTDHTVIRVWIPTFLSHKINTFPRLKANNK